MITIEKVENGFIIRICQKHILEDSINIFKTIDEALEFIKQAYED